MKRLSESRDSSDLPSQGTGMTQGISQQKFIMRNHDKGMIMARKIVMLLLTLMLVFTGIASAGNISSIRARIVARNWLTHVVHAYGSWGGDTSPAISGEESFVHYGVVVGYNFTVNPHGHILISARDDIPAVKLYSETSTLSLQEEGMQETIAWIAEEIFEVGEAIDTHGVEMAAAEHSQNPDRKLWVRLQKDPLEFERVAGEALMEAVSYGPLLTTTWAQGDPYNQQCPLWSTGCRTIVGCVATATSQILKYWNYPTAGQGSKSYSWYNGATNVTLSRDFASSTYDWANMPNSLSSGSTPAQKSAVAKLTADVGVAFNMEYGCNGSGADTSTAPNVFKNYFKYQSTATWVNRTSYASASAWMKVFKAEVQAGRPSQLRIQDPIAGGHSVVVDGYRDSPSETIHINMGWGGSYDGWYTPDSFVTGSFNWTRTSYQGAAIGIQPQKQIQLAASFAGSGVWINNTVSTTWSQLTGSNVENMVASGSTLYGDFGTLGPWKWEGGTTWSQLTGSNVENMVASGSTFYGDFGTLGLWKFDGTTWMHLSASNPENMVVSGTSFYGDFGTMGLWKWDGTTWSQLTGSNVENMVASGSELYVDFGTLGLRKWDGTAWSQLNGNNPISMAVIN